MCFEPTFKFYFDKIHFQGNTNKTLFKIRDKYTMILRSPNFTLANND